MKIIARKFSDKDIRDIQSISSILNSYDNTLSLLAVENGERSQFVISRSKNLGVNLKNIMGKVTKDMDVKGGGSPQAVQGSCSKDDLNNLLQGFYDEILESSKE